MAGRAVALDSTRGGRFTPARPRGVTRPPRSPAPSRITPPEPAPARQQESEPVAAPEPPARTAPVPRASSRPVTAGGSTVDSGAGFILGLLVWGWVALPFLTGGPTAVRNTLRAKFFNKGPDGKFLP